MTIRFSIFDDYMVYVTEGDKNQATESLYLNEKLIIKKQGNTIPEWRKIRGRAIDEEDISKRIGELLSLWVMTQ